MNPINFLEYGALGLLTLVLLGVGWGLKMVFSRWLGQIDAAIKAQDAGANAMREMATAMATLTATVTEHSLATMKEHRLILEIVARGKPAARAKVRANLDAAK